MMYYFWKSPLTLGTTQKEQKFRIFGGNIGRKIQQFGVKSVRVKFGVNFGVGGYTTSAEISDFRRRRTNWTENLAEIPRKIRS